MTPQATRHRASGAALTRQIAAQLRQVRRYDEAARLYAHLFRARAPDPEDLNAFVEAVTAAGGDPLVEILAAVERFPDDSLLRERTVQLLRGRGRDADLLALASRLAGHAGDAVFWRIAAGEAAIRLGRDAEAHALSEAVLAEMPAHAGALRLKARLDGRARSFETALGHLERASGDGAAPDASMIGLAMSANRRLGRRRAAAQEAAAGLDRLLEAGDLAAAARLLRRNGFTGPAETLRRRAGSLDETEARRQIRRMSSHLVQDGLVAEGIAGYRSLSPRGGWSKRLSDRERDRLDLTMTALGIDPLKGIVELEKRGVRLPDTLLHALLDRGMARRPSRQSGTGVLIVSGALGPGGAERQAALTATGLSADDRFGGRVAVATLQDLTRQAGDHLSGQVEAAGVAFHDLAVAPAYESRRLPLELAMYQPLLDPLPPNIAGQIAALAGLIADQRPAVVHGWQDMTGVVTALAGLLSGVPRIVIGTRSQAPDRKEGRNRPFLQALMQRLARHPRVRFCNNSLAGIRDYRQWLGAPGLSIAHVPNGFDFGALALAPPAQRPEGGPVVVGGVMRLTEEKRPLLWLESVLELARAGHPVRGLLVGDGAMRPELEARIATEGAGDIIELAGRRSDMDAQYRRMDLLLLTSRTEGLPNVLIEAQAHGCPVAATPAGGASETFIDGETGLLCPDPSPRAIAARLAPLVDDRDLRLTFGAKAASHSAGTFGQAAMITRTLALYGMKTTA
ncbi:MAG: glycosyltransferase [Minwuia sp.]|uniref:glycosyltransferase n=1 Tax=Minwuia sp. TaxID=2493630 RepID=UPI003A83BEC5